MATENLSVVAAFDLSYANLAPNQQRLFRQMGLHPATDIDGHPAALDGADLATARRGLEALYDQYLIADPARGQYRMHLIREHARALAVRLDPGGDRDQATARLLDDYQYTAGLADALRAPQARPAPAQADPTPAAVPPLSDREQALAWARASARGSAQSSTTSLIQPMAASPLIRSSCPVRRSRPRLIVRGQPRGLRPLRTKRIRTLHLSSSHASWAPW